MKNTLNNRIRLLTILLCLALLIACVVPTVAFADTAANSEQDSVHFINPTAITVMGSYLYVADIVENNKTALLCFEAGESNPEPKYTYELPESIGITGLANNGSDTVYAFGGTTVAELKIADDALPAVNATYSLPQDASEILDVAYGKIPNTERNTVYALTKTAVYQYNGNKFNIVGGLNNLNNARACLAFASVTESPFYYLHDKENKITCDRIYLADNTQSEDFEAKLTLNGFVPAGMLGLNGKVALFNDSAVCTLEESLANVTPVNTLTLSGLYNQECKICDVEAFGERLFVLNSKNQIDVFDKTENGYDTVNYATIGSDTVDKAAPTSYTSFTLVRPNGYPANIVYKTNADTSIDEIITDATEYTVLGYDGDETSHYYYVLVGDKFGWVKKSDNATAPANDNKLTVVNNKPGGLEGIDAEAKFTSLGSVYVFELPLSNAKSITVDQTALTMKTVKLLQEYKEGDVTWYYVSYDEGKTGFVKKSDVGQIHYAVSDPSEEGVELKKINSSLFAAVNLYVSSEMIEGDYVADDDGNAIKLYSGDRVTVLKTENDAAFVMILHSDNSRDCGWIPADKLIGTHQITTNAIVGLSLLAVAIALTTTLLIIYFKRKKKIKRNNG